LWNTQEEEKKEKNQEVKMYYHLLNREMFMNILTHNEPFKNMAKSYFVKPREITLVALPLLEGFHDNGEKPISFSIKSQWDAVELLGTIEGNY